VEAEQAAQVMTAASPVSNCIRRLRFEHGEMTQQQLADAVGVTRQTIIAIEAVKYVPSLELAFRIARIFGARLEETFSYPSEARARTPWRRRVTTTR
jgi:putative transcriptional regulator